MHEVPQARVDHKVLLAHKVQLVQMVKLVPLVLLELVAQLDQMEIVDPQAQLVSKVM